MTDHEIEVAHLRADLHSAAGRTKARLRTWQQELRIALVAHRNNRPDVTEQRIEAVLRQMANAFESIE